MKYWQGRTLPCYDWAMRFAEGEIYHIYNRGVEGRNIFLEPTDYERFVSGLVLFNDDSPIRLVRKTQYGQNPSDDTLVSLIGYTLMKNHVHLLVYCKNGDKFSRFLQKLFGGYTMYFNLKYERKGVLFQGGTKSKHVEDHRYLSHVINYIHLNPLDYCVPEWRAHGVTDINKAKRAIFDYPYSSLKEFCGHTNTLVLDKNIIEEFFPDIPEVVTSMLEWSSETFAKQGLLFLE